MMHRISMTSRLCVLSLTLLLAGRVSAQTPDARPADVASVDAIVQALYAVISGPTGQARDWNRFRSLFLPGARLISTGRSTTGEVRHRVMTPDEYATNSGAFLEASGFSEREIARKLDTFGNIAQAFSTYESHYTQENQARHARGINSIQLFHDGKRWFVVTVFWDSERPDNPIPARYLSGGE